MSAGAPIIPEKEIRFMARKLKMRVTQRHEPTGLELMFEQGAPRYFYVWRFSDLISEITGWDRYNSYVTMAKIRSLAIEARANGWK